MLRIWEFFVIPMYGVMYCKVESCVYAFMCAFYKSLLFTLWGFIFFCNLYLQSFSYCLVFYCPVLHFRTGHCSLDELILCERDDRRISKYIKSQYKRVCCPLRWCIYKIYIKNIYILYKKTELAWLGLMYELLSSMTRSTQCIKYKLGASKCGQ